MKKIIGVVIIFSISIFCCSQNDIQKLYDMGYKWYIIYYG